MLEHLILFSMCAKVYAMYITHTGLSGKAYPTKPTMNFKKINLYADQIILTIRPHHRFLLSTFLNN